jgi:hypothetical protein
MGMTRSQKDAALAELYAQVPSIPACDGRCWVSCGPIEMFDRERQRIRERGVKISDADVAMQSVDTFYCEALKDGRCMVYDIRPMICRIWGAVEDMPCPFGCVPEPGYLTADESMILLAKAHSIAGLHGAALTKDELRAVRNKAMLDVMAAHARKGWEAGRHGIALRVADGVPPAFRKRE